MIDTRGAMKQVTRYEADDGTLWHTQEMCKTHEQRCADLDAANEMLLSGATLMAALTRAHQTRPWWDSGLSLEDKALLMRITKDTGLVIEHWQCSTKPMYRPVKLDGSCKVYVHGDPMPFSGSYGNWVTLDDLLRYARATNLKTTQGAS